MDLKEMEEPQQFNQQVDSIQQINQNEIYQKLNSLYICPIQPNCTQEEIIIIQEWNVVRTDCIIKLLTTYAFKQLEEEVREYLKAEAEKNVILECGRQFQQLLMVGEYKGRIMGVNYDDETGKMYIAIVD